MAMILVMSFVSCDDDDTEITEVNNPNIVNGVDITLNSSEFPFESQSLTVNGVDMFYVDEGAGEDTFVLVHGIPSSSYLWRNVIPHLATRGRVIAMDLAGWGQSGSITDEQMSWANQTAFLEGFIDQLNLDNIIWVVHDLGGPFGLDIAARNTANVKGIVFFETQVAPFPSLDDIPSSNTYFAEFFPSVVRGVANDPDPESGWSQIMDDPDQAGLELASLSSRDFPADARAVYNAPFADQSRRLIVWRSMRGIPILGELEQIAMDDPARFAENQVNAQSVGGIFQFMQESQVPKLAFYGNPGLAFTAMNAPFFQTFPNTEVQEIGTSIHYYQEDLPHDLGIAITEWYDTNF